MAICLKHFQQYDPRIGEKCVHCDPTHTKAMDYLSNCRYRIRWVCPYCGNEIQWGYNHDCGSTGDFSGSADDFIKKRLTIPCFIPSFPYCEMCGQYHQLDVPCQ